MPWIIERMGSWHSDAGWRSSVDAAKRYESPEDADDDRKRLQETTLAGLPGEIHVKEVPR
jgi:hypothetical protein